MHDTETNMHITCTLDKYTKDRDIDPGDYVIADEKPVKVDLYRMFIIIVDTLNGPDTITFTNIVYYFIFFANIASAKHFQFKRVYLNEKHS